jgi:hypothetical protein
MPIMTIWAGIEDDPSHLHGASANTATTGGIIFAVVLICAVLALILFLAVKDHV